jgi:hypothetical protein
MFGEAKETGKERKEEVRPTSTRIGDGPWDLAFFPEMS